MWVGMLEGVGELEDAQDSQKRLKCRRPRQEGSIAFGPAPATSQGALPAAALERPVEAEGKGVREGRVERSAWGAGREGRRASQSRTWASRPGPLRGKVGVSLDDARVAPAATCQVSRLPSFLYRSNSGPYHTGWSEKDKGPVAVLNEWGLDR